MKFSAFYETKLLLCYSGGALNIVLYLDNLVCLLQLEIWMTKLSKSTPLLQGRLAPCGLRGRK